MESLCALYKSIFPPAAKWGFSDMPDLTGKVVIVTGGNAGIAKVMCRELLKHNAQLYLFCRSLPKAHEAIADLVKETGKSSVHAIECDLADLASVKRAAQAFQGQERALHILFNSAGVMNAPLPMLTQQGYDLQFGTNVLGHHYLTVLLLPTLLATAQQCAQVRVITTSSSANQGAPRGGIDYALLTDGPERSKRARSEGEYYMSKWANAVWAKELARRYGPRGIFSAALDPGWLKTALWQYQGSLGALMTGWMLSPPEMGALTPLYAGTSTEAGQCPGGQFFVPWARAGRARSDTEDAAAGKRLWEWCEDQLRSQNL
ncbi:NAD(P)-binding protein [Calocera cornea HHB12733]|uniref:NAD(P)-binding protein n=1 Tax=Calocera cornea HHB12733 TaxID=1353952 RepID=A0A165FH63_9BASI|nr:NAD(P)-binding protein [Calocera cornea HHB12733]